MEKIIIAGRKSELAMRQSNIVAGKLADIGIETEIRTFLTKGDKDKISPLWDIGGDGLFVRRIESALLDGEADIAVHSAKDLPYELMEGLEIAGIPDGEDPRDCLLTKKADIGKKPVIGSSSPRRCRNFERLYPEAVFAPLRGNVPTRVEKLRNGEYDGIILAAAGLKRLGLDLGDLNVRVFDEKEFIPAPCQGILAVECRSDDHEIKEALKRISDENALKRYRVERYLFSEMKADCHAAIGAYAKCEGDLVDIYGCFESRFAHVRGSYSEYRAICDGIVGEIYG